MRVSRRNHLSISISLLLLLAGCGHSPPTTDEAVSQGTKPYSQQPDKSVGALPELSTGERAARRALSQVGVPYQFGGSGPDSFDCSGLVRFAWQAEGVSVPRTTGGLWNQLPAVPADDLRPGDVLFFRIDGKASHVGIYLGQGKFVHAPSSGKYVSTEDLASRYYQRSFIRAGRPRG